MEQLRKLVFFGTHELAVPALEALAALELVPRLVVTPPRAGFETDGDAPPHPVQEWAAAHGVTVRSPRAAGPELHQEVAALAPDLLVVVDYGRPLPAELAAAAARGAVGVHPSLLPKLRGPHALRAALAAGESKSGVTVYLVDEEPWGGPVMYQEELAIGPRDTFADVLPRAGALAADLLGQALVKIDRSKGKPRGKAQNHKIATHTPRFGGQHRKALWTLESAQIYDRLRAYTPPGLLAYYRYRPVEILNGIAMDWVVAPNGETGTYLGLRQGKLAVLCGGATVFGIEQLCRPGTRRLSASDFAHQESVAVGDRFA